MAPTVTRVPRMQGLPPMTAGESSIRSKFIEVLLWIANYDLDLPLPGEPISFTGPMGPTLILRRSTGPVTLALHWQPVARAALSQHAAGSLSGCCFRMVRVQTTAEPFETGCGVGRNMALRLPLERSTKSLVRLKPLLDALPETGGECVCAAGPDRGSRPQ